MKPDRTILGLFALGLLLFVAAMIWGPGLSTLLRQFEFGPFFSGLTLGIPVLAVGLCPNRREAAWLALACLGVEIWRILSQWNPAFVGILTVTGARAAVVAGLHLVVSAWLRPQLRGRVLLALAHGLTLPLLYAGSAGLQKTSSQTETITYDLFYYAADLRLGPPWCFQVFGWSQTNFGFYTLGNLAYFSLSHAMGVAAALWFLRPRGVNPNLLFIASALFGMLGYALAPGVGPKVVFQGMFPMNPPPMDTPQSIVAYPGPPRNTMPSLHLLWAYSCWLALCSQGRRLELIGLVYLMVMPVVAFLGSHYLVDYLATLPAAAAVHLCAQWLVLRAPVNPLLQRLAAAGALLCPAYVVLLVLGAPLWLVEPWMLQSASLVVLLVSIASARLLRRYAINAARPGSDPAPW